MPSTIILTLGPENSFSRSKLQTLSTIQKQNINNLLDKIEVIYQKLLPRKSKVIWIIYFLLLCLFLLSGMVKNISNDDVQNLSRIVNRKSANPKGPSRLLQTQGNLNVTQVPSSWSNPTEGGTPMAASDMNMQQEERPQQFDSNPPRFESDLFYYLKKRVFFLLEVFFICFPLYYLLSRFMKRRMVLGLVKDLIDIENKHLITNCQVKVEISELTVLTIVQFDTEGYLQDLDLSTTKLVLDKRSLSKKSSTILFAPVVSI